MPDNTESPPPAQPDAPDTTADTQRDRSLGGRGIRGHSSILAGRATTPAPAPAAAKRKARNFSLPTDIAERAINSRIHRRDLVLLAARNHADDLAAALRSSAKGRVQFQVRLNDDEHARLQRIARRRGWSLSAAVAVLIDFYLSEIED